MNIFRLRRGGEKLWFRYVKGPHKGPNRATNRASLHKLHASGRDMYGGAYTGHDWKRERTILANRKRIRKLGRR